MMQVHDCTLKTLYAHMHTHTHASSRSRAPNSFIRAPVDVLADGTSHRSGVAHIDCVHQHIATVRRSFQEPLTQLQQRSAVQINQLHEVRCCSDCSGGVDRRHR